MTTLPGNTTGKFRTTKTPEEIQIEATDQIVEAKKGLRIIKFNIEKLKKLHGQSSKINDKEIERQIEMLQNLYEYLENMLDQLGTFTDNLAELMKQYNPKDEYYEDLNSTLNYMLPLLSGIRMVLTKSDGSFRILENTFATNKARSRGDNITYYDGYLNYENQKFQLRFGLRKEAFQASDGEKRQARFVVGIRDAISSNTDDAVTMRLDLSEYQKDRKSRSSLDMDFTYPNSQSITDLRTGNIPLKKRINDTIYENTSQRFTYHFGIKEDVSNDQFRRFGTLVEQLYLKK